MCAAVLCVLCVCAVCCVAGGSLAGYKMNRRVAGLSEFEFVKLGQVVESMEVLVGINGWLDTEADYVTTWQCLQQAAPAAELYVLRWETQHLLAWGAALKSLTLTALAKGWAIGKIKGLLIGSLLAAVAWPMWLVRASDVIDNSYAVILVWAHSQPAHREVCPLHSVPLSGQSSAAADGLRSPALRRTGQRRPHRSWPTCWRRECRDIDPSHSSDTAWSLRTA